MKALKKIFNCVLRFHLFLFLTIMCIVWVVEQLAHRISEVFMPYVSTAITKLEKSYEDN